MLRRADSDCVSLRKAMRDCSLCSIWERRETKCVIAGFGLRGKGIGVVLGLPWGYLLDVEVCEVEGEGTILLCGLWVVGKGSRVSLGNTVSGIMVWFIKRG